MCSVDVVVDAGPKPKTAKLFIECSKLYHSIFLKLTITDIGLAISSNNATNVLKTVNVLCVQLTRDKDGHRPVCDDPRPTYKRKPRPDRPIAYEENSLKQGLRQRRYSSRKIV